MDGTELEQFFERLSAEPETATEGSPDSAARAALLAALTRSRAAPGGSNDATGAQLAAYLSGALDPAEAEGLVAELLRAPDDIYELEAAQSFLDGIAAQKSAAPPELVDAVLADAERERPWPAIPARRSWYVPRWRLEWGLAGGAMAAMALAVIVIWMDHNPVAIGSSVAPPDSSRPVEAALPQPAVGPREPAIPEPVYTAPNPPQAITSHAVTADDYPPASVRLQEQGTVKLNYFIQTDGIVGDCKLIESSGFPRLDDAACVMVRRWQFKPATVLDGSPVAVWMPASIVFALKSDPSAPAFTLQDNRELARVLTGAQADAKAGRFAEALAKAKAADAMPGKPAALVPQIHKMIVAYAVSAKDYAAALEQIEEMIAANEGNKNENLKQALSIANMMNNQAKVAEYLNQLGSNLDPDTRRFIAQQALKRPDVGDLVNRPPPPPPPPTPPLPMTSHAVAIEDYPPVSIRLQEEGKVGIKYMIGTDGSVIECAVTMTSGKPRLDDAACTMAKRKWKFKPATQDGRPVAVSLPAEVVFTLK